MAKIAILRPGMLIFSGYQNPNEAGEKAGRRINTFYLQVGSVVCSPTVAGPSGAAALKMFRARWAKDEERGRDTDVFTVGSNIDGYLGLGLHRMGPLQPDPPPETVWEHPNICLRISALSTNAFEWNLSTQQVDFGSGVGVGFGFVLF